MMAESTQAVPGSVGEHPQKYRAGSALAQSGSPSRLLKARDRALVRPCALTGSTRLVSIVPEGARSLQPWLTPTVALNELSRDVTLTADWLVDIKPGHAPLQASTQPSRQSCQSCLPIRSLTLLGP